MSTNKIDLERGESKAGDYLLDKFGTVVIHHEGKSQFGGAEHYTPMMNVGRTQGITSSTREQCIQYTAEMAKRGWFEGCCGCTFPKFVEQRLVNGVPAFICECGKPVAGDYEHRGEEFA